MKWAEVDLAQQVLKNCRIKLSDFRSKYGNNMWKWVSIYPDLILLWDFAYDKCNKCKMM